MLSAVAARKAAQAQNLANGKSSSEKAADSVKASLVNVGTGNVAATTKKRQADTSSRGTPSANEDETPGKAGSSKKNATPRKKRQRKKDTRRYFDQMDVDDTAMDETEEDELFGLHLTSQPVTPPLQETYVDPIKQGDKKRAWSPSQPVRAEDSSDSFGSDEDVPIPPASIPPAATPTAKDPYALLSTYSPSSKNLFDIPTTSSRSSKLLLLGVEEQVTLLGVYSLAVLKGEVQLQGTRLMPSPFPHEVFAPRCSPLGAITALAASEATDATFDMLPVELRQVVSSYAGCAVLVSDLNTGIEGMGRVVRTFEDMFRPPSGGGYITSGTSDIGLKTAVMVRDPYPQLQPISIPETWTHAIESSIVNLAGEANQSVPRPPVFLVRGPKGSGKSSFSQMLIGGLLQRYKRVALLDTDPGQPIFAPPSLISLYVLTSPFFGPSFANPRIPHRAHFFGSITPRSNPIRWLECVEELVERWRLEVSFSESDAEVTESDERITEVVPLVVNTCGWTKGYGAELLARLEEMCQPDCVCAFPEVGGVGDDPTSSSSSAGLTYILEPIPPSSLSSRFTAADMRNLSLMSYFHSRLSSNLSTSGPSVTWDTVTPLLGVEPWQVTYSSDSNKETGLARAIDKVYLSGPWADDIVHSEIGRVMECAIIGLIIDETSDDTTSSPPISGIPYTQGSHLPSPSESSCPGLGLIRAVDTSRGAFHLLAPLPSPLLPRCRALVKGEVELPVWGFLEFGEDPGSGAPYLDWGKASRRGVVGGERRRVRRNLMRKGQM